MLKEAQDRLDSWREGLASVSREDAEQLADRVRERLRADLDAPGALAAVDAVVQAATGDGSGSPLAEDVVDALLGVRLAQPAEAVDSTDARREV